jgi:signal transduction histidine kinase
MEFSQLTHEIRNILQPVEYQVSVLSARGGNDPHLSRAMTVIPRQLEILQQLLQNVSILSNAMELVPRRMELCGCLNSIAKRVSAESAVKNVKIMVLGVPQPTHTMLDEYWFPLAIEHLFRNAAEAVAESQEKNVRVDVLVNGKIRIDVQDNGSGVNALVRDKLFEPFNTTKNQAGAGFGLAIARKIIETHGGTVTLASSETAPRTRVTLELPFVAG